MTVLSDDSNFLTWSAWKEGDAFALGVQDVEGNPAGAYEALNMQVYVDGTLGVRPWLRNWNPSGSSWNPGNLGSNETLASVALENVGGSPGIYIYSEATHNTNRGGYQWFPGTNSWSQAYGTSGVTSVFPARLAVATNQHPGLFRYSDTAVLLAGRILVIPGTSQTAVTLPASWVPHHALVHKNRAYTWGDATDPNRVHYSAVNDYATWDALDFFNIGGVAPVSGGVDSYVVGLFSLSDALMIYTDRWDWFALTGASPETGTLRETHRGRTPNKLESAVVFKDRIMFMEAFGIGGITVVTPSGEDLALDDIRPRAGQAALPAQPSSTSGHISVRSAVASRIHDSVHFNYVRYQGLLSADTDDWGSGAKAIELVNGAWNMTGYWMSSERSNGAVDFSSVTATSRSWWSHQLVLQDRALAFVAQENTSPNTPLVYTRDITLNRPSRDDDYWSAKSEQAQSLVAGGDSAHKAAGEVRLRNISAPDGNLIRVARVLVDATYWKDGAEYEIPAITAYAVGPAGEQQLTVHGWSGASLADVADDAGARTRIRFSAPVMPFEDEVRVELRGIQSLALRSVTVEFETEAFLDV